MRWVALMVWVLLAACSRPADEPVKPPVYWACEDFEMAAVPLVQGVTIYLPGKEPIEVGHDRFRVTDGEATLTTNEVTARCTPKTWGGPWQAASERGADFRAVGQEPGWLLELTEGGEILIGLDYGERALAVPTPSVSLLGGARGYHAQHEGTDLMLLIEDLPCFDVMSGEVFPETVTLQVQGVRYSGCGLSW